MSQTKATKETGLYENFPLQLVWRWKPISRNIDWFGQQHVPKDLLEVLSHISLLGNTAVIFNGQDDRVAARQTKVAAIRVEQVL